MNLPSITARATGWLAARSRRERRLLGAMAGLCALWLGWAAMWQPLLSARAALDGRIARAERGLAALDGPAAAESAPLAAPDPRAVPVILTESAAPFALAIRRLETEGPGARVVLEEAGFDQILLWLEALERDHGLRITDLAMTRRPEPGVVATTLAVER